jgi:hypothetical protein
LTNKKTASILGDIAQNNNASVTVTEAKLLNIKSKFKFEFCEDKSINTYLNNKGTELYSNEVNNNLNAGQILTEVFDKLSGSNQYDGLYNTWLGKMEYNARTALRHRIRYNLFMAATTEEGKSLFATLPVRLLDKLNVHNEKEQFIDLVNNSDIKSKDDLVSFMESENVEEVNEKFKSVTPFYRQVFSYEKKVKKMSQEEANLALTELEDIEKEVRKIKKLLKEKKTSIQ